MTYGDYPSEALIHRLADALDADEDELLLLAEKIPQQVRQRVLQRPDAFRAFASCGGQESGGVVVGFPRCRVV